MTQAHFITGTTLTFLLAVAVLGNAPSATAESTDVADITRGNIGAASPNDPSSTCDVDEAGDENASTQLDVDADADVAPTLRDEETAELARRVSAALLGQAKPANVSVARATKTKDAADAGRVWHCGEWEELWQGRGNARTCEWQ